MEPRQSSFDDQQYEFRLGEGAAHRRGAARVRRGLPQPPRNPFAARKSAGGKAASLAVKCKPNFLPPEASAEEAFRLTLQHCKWHVLANLPAVVEARDGEGIHQLRVALRRLRVALAAFGRAFRTPGIEALRMRAKLLAAGLGPARDMDVFLDELLEPAEADCGAPEAFLALRERAELRRREAWDYAVREAAGLAFHNFLHDLGEAIDHREWYRVSEDGRDEPQLAIFTMPARELAGQQLSHHLQNAKKCARKLETLSDAKRHELRIALKKLRYAVEFFAGLYSADTVKPFVRRLAQMQELLGGLQDVAVARATLQALIAEPPESLFVARSEVCFAAGTVHGWHLERASQAWVEAKSRWKRFAKVEPFWERA